MFAASTGRKQKSKVHNLVEASLFLLRHDKNTEKRKKQSAKTKKRVSYRQD
jgi:hypothetical protein